MAKKSSKTAHVLNLLSSSSGDTQSKTKDNSETVQKISPMKESLNKAAKNNEIASKIKNTLETELEKTIEAEAPQKAETHASNLNTEEAAASSESGGSFSSISFEELSAETLPENNIIVGNPAFEQDNNVQESEVQESETQESEVQKDVVHENASQNNTAFDEQNTFEQNEGHEAPQNGFHEESLPKNSAKSELSEASANEAVDNHETEDGHENETAVDHEAGNSLENEQHSLQSESSYENDEEPLDIHFGETQNDDVSDEEFYYVNIGEMLVKELVPEYMEKFGVCKCGRCTADVMAMSLSKLVPKYIVTNDRDLPMLVNYYKEKMTVAVITEITKACFSVIEKPRHKK
ncbi:MAG: hypothetical protein HFE62_05265 [Firmicutes bacterium]|nr:hypothetical protein [Bacillota bacterium]